jgi:hypothetical protein
MAVVLGPRFSGIMAQEAVRSVFMVFPAREIALGKYCCFLVVKALLDHSLTVVALLWWGCFGA